METKAVTKFIRISARKIRLLMDEVRGRKVDEAVNMLSFAPQKGAGILKKLIKSAASNAEQNSGIDVDSLFIKHIYADEGPILKRFIPRAQGRSTKIRKRTSHLTVVLDDRDRRAR
ncbi:MAG: 50S ribosomal protein L22 [Deltaproteobacteria bacterium]|nr:50S ribosomal protein L22 [Deltaproteobacteria bacterium]